MIFYKNIYIYIQISSSFLFGLQVACEKVCYGLALNTDDFLILSQCCLPIFYCLQEGYLQEPLRPVWREVMDMSIKALDAIPHPLHPCDNQKDLAFFPSLPIIRQRGTYEMDKNRTVMFCTKQSGHHPTLTPGVFMMMCEHGNISFL